MSRVRRYFRPLALALALSVTTACIGRFAAVRMVYDFNTSITDSKYVHTLVLWGFLIFPVYQLAATADFFILNVIEFWTGSNLLADATTPSDQRLAAVKVEDLGDGRVAFERDGLRYTVTSLPGGGAAFASDQGLLGVAEPQADGSVQVFDADGKLLRTVPGSDLVAMQEALGDAVAN